MKIKHLTFIFYVMITILFFLLLISNSHVFIKISEEGKIVEWITFWCYLLAAGIFIYLLIKIPKIIGNARWFVFVIVLGCIFVAGEEISWGQHLLDFKTPDVIIKHNFQNEFNIHNLGEWGKDGPRRLYMILLFAYLILFQQLAVRVPMIARIADRFGVIIPDSGLMVPFLCSLALPLYIKALITVDAPLPVYHNYSTEIMEMISGFVFVHFAVLEFMKYRNHIKVSQAV